VPLRDVYAPTCVAPKLRDTPLLVNVDTSPGRAGNIDLKNQLRRRIGREVHLPPLNLAYMLHIRAGIRFGTVLRVPIQDWRQSETQFTLVTISIMFKGFFWVSWRSDGMVISSTRYAGGGTMVLTRPVIV
jgi:hypothetical protein